MHRPGRATILVALFAVAIAARAAAALWWDAHLPDDRRFGFGDSVSYWNLAASIATRQPYAHGEPAAYVFRTPGYPLALAPIFRLTDGQPAVLTVRLYNAGISALVVVGVFLLGQKLFDDAVGFLAAGILAIYPGLVALGAFILTEGLFCAVVPFQLVAWHNAWSANTQRSLVGWSLGTGALAGAATLVRPSWLLFLPFAMLVCLVLCRHRRRQLATGVLLLIGLTMVMTPWWLRNWQITGRFVPTTLQVGASLVDGLGPQATGASAMEFVPGALAEFRRQAGEPNQWPVDWEYQFDRYLRQQAFDWAQANPVQAFQLAWHKFTRIWNVWPNDPQFRAWPVRILVLVSYVPLLAAALIGIWRYSRGGLPYVVCWLPAVYLTGLHLIAVGSIRYRVPAMVTLSVLGAAVAVETGRAFVNRSGSTGLATSKVM